MNILEDLNETKEEEVQDPPADDPASQDAAGTDEEAEVIVSIGDPIPPPEDEPRAPEWVRELRKNHRELQRENKELKAKLQAPAETPKLWKEPELEDDGIDYDPVKFKEALRSWYDRKREVQAEEDRIAAEQKTQDDAWQVKVQNYGKLKAELRVKDFEEAEAEAQGALSQVQLGIILKGAKNPAIAIYAIGKDKAEREALAAIKDPVEFTWAAAQMEMKMKVTERKAVPPPERTITSTSRVSGTVDSKLESLQAQAEDSGDYTKVLEYKRQLKQKA